MKNKNKIYGASLLLIILTLVTFVSATNYNITNCSTINQSGNYVLQNSIQVNDSCFKIETSNVTLNLNGYTLLGNGTGIAVASNSVRGTDEETNLTYSILYNNLTIKNGIISNFSIGVWITGSSASICNGANYTNCTYYWSPSSNHVIENNTFNYNNNKAIDFSDGIINISIKNNTIYNNEGCILVQWGLNNNITNNNCTNNHYTGILVNGGKQDEPNLVSNTYVWGNIINSHDRGIQIGNISGAYFINNNLINNSYGIFNINSERNNIYNNFLNNTINFYNFYIAGEYIHSSDNWNTTKTNSTNIISGSFIGGNFWATPTGTGYSETCNNLINDSFCDVTYKLDDYNTDYLPLTNRITTENITLNSSTVPSMSLIVENHNLTEWENLTGLLNVDFNRGNKKIAEFAYNFTNGTINFENITLEQGYNESGAVKGYVLIKGLDTTKLLNGTKTLYMDNLNSTLNWICIKDADIDSIGDITANCKGTNEYQVQCNGQTKDGYTCTLNSTLNQYKVTGLRHSGVTQTTTPTCSDGIQNQDETSIDCGGSCGACSSETGGSSGGSGGGSSTKKIINSSINSTNNLNGTGEATNNISLNNSPTNSNLTASKRDKKVIAIGAGVVLIIVFVLTLLLRISNKKRR